MWVWVPPDEMERIGMISTHTANFHYKGSEASYFKSIRKLQFSLGEPGDLLVFPPLWGHSVITQAGPNVMLNLRQRTLWKSFSMQPLRFLETLFSTKILGNTQHATAKFNKLQMELYKQREKHYEAESWVPPESACKNLYSKILNRWVHMLLPLNWFNSRLTCVLMRLRSTHST